MRAPTQYLAAGLSLVLVAACAPAGSPADTAADVAAINAVREQEMALVAAGSADSLAAVYAADVVVMPPNEPAVNGMEALRTWAQAMFGQMSMTGRYTSSQVTVAGDWAVDRYTAVLTATPKAGGAAMEEQIKGVHIMHRGADGAWRIAQDVWNSDAPPPPPPAKR